MSYRQFGWRLLSKLGVDYRKQGSEKRMLLAVVQNAYTTCVKLDVLLLVRSENWGGMVLGAWCGGPRHLPHARRAAVYWGQSGCI